MSFVALKLRHDEFMHQLEDGTANFPVSCAFPATLVDNDTYFYGQAMRQPVTIPYPQVAILHRGIER